MAQNRKKLALFPRADISSFVFNVLTLSNDIPGMVSYLDNASQGRIDDPGAPDPTLAPNDEPSIP
jgi:hypothetical protein